MLVYQPQPVAWIGNDSPSNPIHRAYPHRRRQRRPPMPFTIPRVLKHCTIPLQSTPPFLLYDATVPKGRTSPASFDSHVMSLPLLHIPNPPPCIYPTFFKPTLSFSSRPELAVQPSIMSCQSCLTTPIDVPLRPNITAEK